MCPLIKEANKPWINDECLTIIEERRNAESKGTRSMDYLNKDYLDKDNRNHGEYVC